MFIRDPRQLLLWVRAYTRVRFGKLEYVTAHFRRYPHMA